MSPARRKVLFLIPSLAGGGAERVFSILLTYLDHGFFELHLGILEDQGVYMGDVPVDVTVHRLNVSRVRYAMPYLLRLVWKLRPETILATQGNLNLILALSRPFMPRKTRMIIREAAIQSVALQGETRYPRFFKWLYRRLYKRADAVVCLSDSMVNDMVKHFNVPREKLVRIYNPVDTKRVRELAARGENPYSGPGPRLVAAGRLTRQKGFDLLLEALPPVLQRFPNARLTILGQGPLRGELLDMSRRLGVMEHVDFLGFQSNPWLYLKHADLFVFPSRYEGTPNVLLEALALGTRVVASDCPGGVREIGEGNESVILVPPEDANALGRALISELDRVADHVALPPSSSSLRKFELARVVEEYSKIL